MDMERGSSPSSWIWEVENASMVEQQSQYNQNKIETIRKTYYQLLISLPFLSTAMFFANKFPFASNTM